ncbi:MAG: zinc metallopeptidase [Bacteroidetes bacterium]|nr:zinc metallopeptidase [Bacteroidota bacterium]MBU1580887.1 zinc metallopeptidase [Bacteroidota bacterium]MBU2465284.1 zinc metallopeptidase [Bacteroidota bacterium]MBU2559111.1 zinc metallopeptidase [Bacteroidota bacterium]
MVIWIIFGFFMLLSWIVSNQLKSKFSAYSKIPVSNGMSGSEIANKMLIDNRISGVKVLTTAGSLSDHYNPVNKTINLSRDVFEGRNIAAAAVAAHECGHAIQHATAYHWLQMRSALVPIVSFSSKWVQWVLLAGILFLQSFPQLLLAGIVLFALTTLFSLITLPVEIDASNRALTWLETSEITSSRSHTLAQEALRWAAYTYVVAALASLATLIYYIAIFIGGRRD